MAFIILSMHYLHYLSWLIILTVYWGVGWFEQDMYLKCLVQV